MKVKSESEVAQSSPTLRDPMDCSLPGSSVHGIFQARVLEWVAIAFSNIKLFLIDFEDRQIHVQVLFLPLGCVAWSELLTVFLACLLTYEFTVTVSSVCEGEMRPCTRSPEDST